jgi:DICT domain-containing protein
MMMIRGASVLPLRDHVAGELLGSSLFQHPRLLVDEQVRAQAQALLQLLHRIVNIIQESRGIALLQAPHLISKLPQDLGAFVADSRELGAEDPASRHWRLPREFSEKPGLSWISSTVVK